MGQFMHPIAAQAQPGMIVSRQNQYSPMNHTILEVNPFPGRDIQIVTNEGTWIFDMAEEVRFPRRLDNSKKDWTEDPDAVFTPMDLAVGDILPSQVDRDPRKMSPALRNDTPDKAYEIMLANYMSTRQIVTSVWAHPRITTLWHVGTHTPPGDWNPRGQHRRYDVRPDQPMFFPYVKPDPASKANERPPMIYTAYGPYAVPSEPNAVVMFAVHPNGRGRWPSELAGRGLRIEISPHSSLYIVRPPSTSTRTAWDWDNTTYLAAPNEADGNAQYLRHPRDPQNGKTGRDWNDRFPGLREAAMEAYERYRSS